MVQKYPEHVAGLTLANHLAYELVCPSSACAQPSTNLQAKLRRPGQERVQSCSPCWRLAAFCQSRLPRKNLWEPMPSFRCCMQGQVGADSSDDEENTAMRPAARPAAAAAAQSAQSTEPGRVHLKEAGERICPLLANGNQPVATWVRP